MYPTIKQSFVSVERWLFPGGDCLVGMVLLFFASAFFLYPATLWTMVFYVGVLPVTLYALTRGVRPAWHTPCFLLACVLIGWSMLTLVWGEDPGKGRVLKFALGGVFTLGYLLSLSMALRRDPQLPRRIADVFIVMGSLNALVCSLIFLFFSSAERLTGWAETRNSILGALVIGVAYVFAFHRFLHEKTCRWLYGLASVLCLLFIALTQSRGPYIATLVATVVLLATVPWRQRLTIARDMVLLVALGVAARFAFYAATPADIVGVIAERGTSHRLDIWSFTFDRIMEHPWIGQGPAAYLGMDEFAFPHNLYLSTLFYNGFIGFGLLLALLGLVGVWLFKKWRQDPDAPVLLALFMLATCGGLTDLGQVAPGPAPIWIILWLPLSLIFARMHKSG